MEELFLGVLLTVVLLAVGAAGYGLGQVDGRAAENEEHRQRWLNRTHEAARRKL